MLGAIPLYIPVEMKARSVKNIIYDLEMWYRTKKAFLTYRCSQATQRAVTLEVCSVATSMLRESLNL